MILEPRSFRVNQEYNDYVYFIKRHCSSDGWKWFVFYGSENLPDFFSIYAEFRGGFETPELAAEQLEAYLKAQNWR